MLTYKQLRQRGWLAYQALWFLRADAALTAAEESDQVRIRWRYDEDYVPDGDYDLDYERKMLAEGTWTAEACFVEVPEHCPHCDHVIEGEWEEKDALWGIVLSSDYVDRRHYECEVAVDAGVIDNPMIWSGQRPSA